MIERLGMAISDTIALDPIEVFAHFDGKRLRPDNETHHEFDHGVFAMQPWFVQ